MSGDIITFQGNRQELTDTLRKFHGILTGQEPDPNLIAQGVYLTLGFAALGSIKEDYERKASGATGEDRVKWPPLKPQTIANRRFGPGEKAEIRAKAGLGKGNRYGPGNNKGLLTATELREWKHIYSYVLKKFLMSMGLTEAKKRAAAVAWTKLKAQGAKTILGVYGSRQVDILRDTGRLLNSLSQGTISGYEPGATYQKPSGEGGNQQIMEVMKDGVRIGSNVKYAGTHQYGNQTKGVPPRPYLPTSQAGPPQVWWDRWLEAVELACESGLRMTLTNFTRV